MTYSELERICAKSLSDDVVTCFLAAELARAMRRRLMVGTEKSALSMEECLDLFSVSVPSALKPRQWCAP